VAEEVSGDWIFDDGGRGGKHGGVFAFGGFEVRGGVKVVVIGVDKGVVVG
jgi:hypothetical protein